jgi:uroporphyrinogen III methyltransferase/synthase
MDWTAFDQNIRAITQFDWAVFTSSNGVRACFDRLHQLGLPNELFQSVQLAAIGPATAVVLQSLVTNHIIVPSRHDTSGFLSEIGPYLTNQRILLLRAEQGRTDLRDGLRAIATVSDTMVYRQLPSSAPNAAIRAVLDAGQIDIIMLTSANAARSMIAHLTVDARQWIMRGRMRLLVNSAATAAAVVDCGLPVARNANGSTVEDLVAGALMAAIQKE